MSILFALAPLARPDDFTLGEQRSPPPPPSPVPPPPALDGTLAAACSDACPHARDGECDDGGDGSLYMACAHGTDCMDCGERPHASPPQRRPFFLRSLHRANSFFAQQAAPVVYLC